MTELELNAIAERAEKATPGPWEWRKAGCGVETLFSPREKEDLASGGVLSGWDDSSVYANPADMAFIAHARTDIPALIAEVRRLRAEIPKQDGQPIGLRGPYFTALVAADEVWVEDSNGKRKVYP